MRTLAIPFTVNWQPPWELKSLNHGSPAVHLVENQAVKTQASHQLNPSKKKVRVQFANLFPEPSPEAG